MSKESSAAKTSNRRKPKRARQLFVFLIGDAELAEPPLGVLVQDRENRIRANHALLQSLQALWDEYPEWRFGQLVMNLSREDDGFADTWEWTNSDWHRRIEEASRTWAK